MITPQVMIKVIPNKLRILGNLSPNNTPSKIEKTMLLYPMAEISPLLPKVNALVK